MGLFFFLNYTGLHHSMGFSLVVASGSYSLVAMQGMFIAVTHFDFWPQGMWDPSSLTSDQSHTLCTER